MKKLLLLLSVWSLFLISSARAADVTVYYSPTCPHCHHALQFFNNELVYEYKTVKINSVNVMDEKNLPLFRSVLEKCKYDNGGVPVIVIGEKCFQGYAPQMNQELRDAVSVGLSDQEKSDGVANTKAFVENPEKFRAENPVSTTTDSAVSETEKKSDNKNNMSFILAFAAVAIVLILLKRKRKN